MIFPQPVRSRNQSSKTVIFTGGINETLSNLEMKPGECYDLENYEEVSGEFHGYRSTPGFERIDGTSEEILNPSVVTAKDPYFYLDDGSWTDSSTGDGAVVITADTTADPILTYATLTSGADYLTGRGILTQSLSLSIGTEYTIRVRNTSAEVGRISVDTDLVETDIPANSSTQFTFTAGATSRDLILSSPEVNAASLVLEYCLVDKSSSVSTISYPSDVSIPYIDNDDFTVRDDQVREERRTKIQTPPLTGGGYLKGAFEFNGDYFIIAYENSNGDHLLFRMADNSGAGWEDVSSFPSISEGSGVDAGINYHIEIGRFELYPLVSDNATPNTDIAILCNGISPAIILYTKDDGTYGCVSLEEANGPDYDASIYTVRLPSDTTIQEAYPIRSIVYNQRLHLAFPYGTLFVSHVGDPFYFDNALKSAGVWWLGSEITDMEVAPSSLVVFMEKGIDIIRPSDPDLVTGFDEVKESFSPLSGAKPNTAQRILGRTLFCDDRGITALETVGSWGDFAVSRLSKKIEKTYLQYKDSIAGTAVDREKNQYIVYFKNGRGITLTVEPNYRGDFGIKGITSFSLGTPISTVWGIKKEPKRLFTTTEDAYLRLQHKDAYCFDGEPITSKFTTSFHPYNRVIDYKSFQRTLVELTASKGNVFSVRPLFDYRGSTIPKASIYYTDPVGDTGIWGTGVWSVFVWGGTGAVNQAYFYTTGIGFNMAIQFTCTSKYHQPHIIHNMIVSYINNGINY